MVAEMPFDLRALLGFRLFSFPQGDVQPCFLQRWVAMLTAA